jgi:hypothetical protein
LRIKVDKAGTTFKVTAQRGTMKVATPATLTSDTWYYFIYSEYRNSLVPTISLAYGTNLATMQSVPAAIDKAPLPPTQSDIVLGAMQSSALSTAKEDFLNSGKTTVTVKKSLMKTDKAISKKLQQRFNKSAEVRLAPNGKGSHH